MADLASNREMTDGWAWEWMETNPAVGGAGGHPGKEKTAGGRDHSEKEKSQMGSRRWTEKRKTRPKYRSRGKEYVSINASHFETRGTKITLIKPGIAEG